MLDMCLKACEKLACAPDNDLHNGCSQMYSCPHACMIRHLGVDEDQCNRMCDRNGGSGCTTSVNGYEFALCRKCNREGCSTHPTVDECKIGCTNYGRNY